MQQAVKQNVGISSMSAHKLNKNMTIKINNNKDSMLKFDQDNIQENDSITKTTRYTTM